MAAGTYDLGTVSTAFIGAANREDLLDVVTIGPNGRDPLSGDVQK